MVSAEILEMPAAGPVDWEEKPRRSCVVCAFPRTGSTLLCYGLEDSGLAGRPTEYFGPTGEARFAREWGLPARYSLRGYLRSMAAGTMTGNGVLATKLMLPHLTTLLRRARAEFGPGLSENELLGECFPNPRFIFLRRADLVRQAVSFLRAINTFQFESGPGGGTVPEAVLSPDMGKITAYAETFRRQEREWREFFERNHITAHEVVYEELAADYQPVVFAALGSLGITPPEGLALPRPRLARQSDEATERIVAAYAEYQARTGAEGGMRA
jgi:LPS sulfotransferase NodH